MKIIYIYGLRSPDESLLSYIGRTDNPDTRLTQHLSDARRDQPGERNDWIRSLLEDGLEPEMVILETCTEAYACECETRWIDGYSIINRELVNTARTRKKAADGDRVIKVKLSRRLESSLSRLRSEYEIGTESIVIHAIDYLDEHRPTLEIVPETRRWKEGRRS